MGCYSAYGPPFSPSLDCSLAGRYRCPDRRGCPPGLCPDFQIKRHDTRPPFQVKVEDCDGPMDLAGLVIEANMWAKGKLKNALTAEDSYFTLADNIGFDQIMVGDIIIMDRARMPEHMLVTGFDEANALVLVERGYNATAASPWRRGAPLRIMKFMNAPAISQMVYQDITDIAGQTRRDVVTDSMLVYEWKPADVCLPGCYYLEFKILKMAVIPESVPEPLPSISNLDPVAYGCTAGLGVEWSRRFPVNEEGYLIQITDSPTVEIG